MVNHLLEMRQLISFSALRLCVPTDPSSIPLLSLPPYIITSLLPLLRTHFQVPYPASPLLATHTKTPGVWGYSSHFGSPRATCAKGARHSPLLFWLGDYDE